MAIEFSKVMDQIFKLSAMIDELDFDIGDRLHIARSRFEATGDVDAVRERVTLVRQSDISGYRGAAPLDEGLAEPPNAIFPPPAMPPQATIIAADGSQIYPDERAPVHYYLINTGLFVFEHGQTNVPQQITVPELFYHKAHVHDSNRQVITNRTVDARRTLTEMKRLAEAAWELRKYAAGPLVTLYDNRLLFWAGDDVTNSVELMKDYQSALTHLHDSGATLGGYVDNPRGTVMLRMLHLMSLKNEAEVREKRREIEAGGDLEGLRDQHLFNSILKPGERSAIMVQNSPKNRDYRNRGVNYEIAFFYIKVGNFSQSAIARVDIPVWVARTPGAVDLLHATIVSQCNMQGRNPYPYALTRADELARVTGKDRRKLDDMIQLELRRKGINPNAIAPKSRGKLLAHSDSRGYELRTDVPRNDPF